MPIKNKTIKPVHSVLRLPESWVVLDFETTGLDPVNSKIIEIGAVRFTGGVPVAIFNTLVKQDPELYPVTEEMQKLTGHTPADVARGMEEAAAIDVLLSFIDNSLIVGQNVLFDYAFLHSAAKYCLDSDIEHDLLDTLTIGRDRKPYPHKLENLCKHYGVENEGTWHSAYFDALATGHLLLAMHGEDSGYIEAKQVASYINVIGYKRKYGEPEWYPDWVGLKPQGATIIQH